MADSAGISDEVMVMVEAEATARTGYRCERTGRHCGQSEGITSRCVLTVSSVRGITQVRQEAECGQLMGGSKSRSVHDIGIPSGMEFAGGVFEGRRFERGRWGLLGGLAPVGERGGRDYRLARGERLLPGIKNMTIHKQ